MSYIDAPYDREHDQPRTVEQSNETSILIVAGCSVAHGCETYNGFMHPENVRKSFSQHLANRIGVNLCNIALSGASNDYIFFSAIQELEKSKNIHSLIVSWTSISRLTWNNNNRYWMFIPGWATSIERYSNHEFAEWKRNIQDGSTSFNSDRPEDIDILKSQHRFFIDNYLYDLNTLTERLQVYRIALQAICKERDIKLVEITPFNLSNGVYRYGHGQPWNIRARHPTKEEHVLIAQEIFDKFYSNA